MIQNTKGNLNMKFMRENSASVLTVLFLVIVGILLLVNPVTFGIVIIKIAGILLALLGIVDIVKYLRTSPEEAAQGQLFFSGAVSVTAGCFLFFATDWFVKVFPILAVVYGLLQVLIGFRNLQATVDALRLKKTYWYLIGISAALSLLFGFIIVLNPTMSMMSIWAFTGITMIVEGVFDAVALGIRMKQK